LIATGNPASGPRSAIGRPISAFAADRARSKHTVGKALTAPSTRAIRASKASRHSSGDTSPAARWRTTCNAVRGIRSWSIGILAPACPTAASLPNIGRKARPQGDYLPGGQLDEVPHAAAAAIGRANAQSKGTTASAGWHSVASVVIESAGGIGDGARLRRMRRVAAAIITRG
jgi:hypothetical protein